MARKHHAFESHGVSILKCQVCGTYVQMLTHVHIRKHELTQEEYCIIWPEFAKYMFWGDIREMGGEKKFNKIRKKTALFDKAEQELREAEEMEFKNPYWDSKTRIELLQKWIIVHSVIYYQLNSSVIPDWMFDENCKQLKSLMFDKPDAFVASKYYDYFKDFNGVTGFDIYHKLSPQDKSDFKIIAMRVRNMKNDKGN